MNYVGIYFKLTNMETQWAHITPITSVPTRPSIRPLFLKALGTANIPDPKLPLNK